MRHLVRLTDWTEQDVYHIFRLTDEISAGQYGEPLKGKTVVMFFPASSVRTRVTFEKGIVQLGGQAILFPSETLDKKEEIRDVCGYLNNWADLVIVRHRDIALLEKMAKYLTVPLINAMTDVNHPCEILSDLYALSKIREDFRKDKFLFVGKKGNIGLAWKEAADVLGISLEQCCGAGYEIDGLTTHQTIEDAVMGKDIVCTDALPVDAVEAFTRCRVTAAAMKKANNGAVLNPCPPFYRGEEVSADAIDSAYFVGYGFKKHLLTVQQAIMLHCIEAREKR
jgi:ornithine carbamoyltransferase